MLAPQGGEHGTIAMDKRWLFGVVIGVAVGAAAGVSGFTFLYAKGGSYLTDRAEACANCHVMRDEYDGWLRSSHRSVATCNDCHTPPGFVGKYWTKASNGWHHSIAFTTGDFAEPIRIKPHNLEIVETACRKCHAEMVSAIDASAGHDLGTSCVRCHDSVGHPK